MSAKPSIAFLVTSCDAYSDLWKPFFEMFFKYWPDCPFSVYLMSNYEVFEDDRVTNIRIGEDVSYSDNLRSALGSIDEDWIILWLDDLFISEVVSTKRVISLYEEGKKAGASFIKLSADLPVSYEVSSGELGELPKGVRYRTAVGVTLIEKSFLFELSTPGMDAWEMDRSSISDTWDKKVMALTVTAIKNLPIRYIHTVVKGRWLRRSVPALKREGYEELLKGRPVQPFHLHLYTQAYMARSAVYRFLRIYWK